MARSPISVQAAAFAGLAPSYGSVDNTNGNYFNHPGGNVLIHVKNTNASPRTLTLTTTNVAEGVALTSPVYTIPANTGDMMILLRGEASRLAVNGQILMDWSASTGVSVAVVSV